MFEVILNKEGEVVIRPKSNLPNNAAVTPGVAVTDLQAETDLQKSPDTSIRGSARLPQEVNHHEALKSLENSCNRLRKFARNLQVQNCPQEATNLDSETTRKFTQLLTEAKEALLVAENNFLNHSNTLELENVRDRPEKIDHMPESRAKNDLLRLLSEVEESVASLKTHFHGSKDCAANDDGFNAEIGKVSYASDETRSGNDEHCQETESVQHMDVEDSGFDTDATRQDRSSDSSNGPNDCMGFDCVGEREPENEIDVVSDSESGEVRTEQIAAPASSNEFNIDYNERNPANETATSIELSDDVQKEKNGTEKMEDHMDAPEFKEIVLFSTEPSSGDELSDNDVEKEKTGTEMEDHMDDHMDALKSKEIVSFSTAPSSADELSYNDVQKEKNGTEMEHHMDVPVSKEIVLFSTEPSSGDELSDNDVEKEKTGTEMEDHMDASESKEIVLFSTKPSSGDELSYNDVLKEKNGTEMEHHMDVPESKEIVSFSTEPSSGDESPNNLDHDEEDEGTVSEVDISNPAVDRHEMEASESNEIVPFELNDFTMDETDVAFLSLTESDRYGAENETEMEFFSVAESTVVKTDEHSYCSLEGEPDSNEGACTKKEHDGEIFEEVLERTAKRDNDDDDYRSNFVENNSVNVTPARKRKRAHSAFSDASESLDEGDSDSPTNRTKKKIRTADLVSDEAVCTPGKGRRNIAEIISDEELGEETRKTSKEEEARKNRVEERKVLLNEIGIQGLVLDYNAKTGEKLIQVHPKIVEKLKPHQVDGIRFMFDACYESVERAAVSRGGGCILAHCMGLGKTFQTIALIHTLLSTNKIKTNTVLVLCPLTTISNWTAEFEEWLADVENRDAIKVYDLQKHKNDATRADFLSKWSRNGGVMILNYDMFRSLVNPDSKNTKEIHKKQMISALLKPGPDLLVCDEGHVLKNENTALSRATMSIRTSRRIILTGTPLQNNLKEYHCMVQLVKPNLLGTKGEFLNRFVNPITNGQYKDSNPEDVELMKKRCHVLYNKLDGIVQRLDFSLLKTYLEPKYEFVISVSLSDLQAKLYKFYIDNKASRTDSGRVAGLFSNYQTLLLLWNHPLTLKLAAETKKKTKKADGNQVKTDDTWWRRLSPNAQLEAASSGPKLILLLAILRHCERVNDKLLVFSSSIPTLNMIEYFLNQERCGAWKKDVDYYRLDGEVSNDKRTKFLKNFNRPDNTRGRLFLLSTEAGGFGINMTAANRVIIFNASWNPASDCQSIFRVYRLGQKKPCYIYRFVSQGTMEERIYKRQVTKLSVACRVVDEQQIERHYYQKNISELYTFDRQFPTGEDFKLPDNDFVMAELLKEYKDIILDYHEHDSLLENKPEENLTEEQQFSARQQFEVESAITLDLASIAERRTNGDLVIRNTTESSTSSSASQIETILENYFADAPVAEPPVPSAVLCPESHESGSEEDVVKSQNYLADESMNSEIDNERASSTEATTFAEVEKLNEEEMVDTEKASSTDTFDEVDKPAEEEMTWPTTTVGEVSEPMDFEMALPIAPFGDASKPREEEIVFPLVTFGDVSLPTQDKMMIDEESSFPASRNDSISGTEFLRQCRWW